MNQERITLIDDIVSLIPQKPPFVMVSNLLYVDEMVTRSSLTIKADTVFVKNNVFQEAGLMENIAQTAALRAGYLACIGNKPVLPGFIGAVKDFEVFGLPAVNEVLVTEIVVENQIFDVTVISGRIWRNDELIAKCEMKVFSGNKADSNEH